jgi:hypothetical protein
MRDGTEASLLPKRLAMKSTLALQALLAPSRPLTRRQQVRWRRLLRAMQPPLAQASSVIVVLALAWVVLFAVSQYSLHRATVIEVETGRFVREFRAEPVVSAWQRLSETWQAELPRQRALLTPRGGEADPVMLLRRFRPFLFETIEEQGLQPEIETVLAFFRRLALCVRMGSCDPVLIATELGDLPQHFRNQHHLYLEESHPGEDIDRYFELVRVGPHRVS